MFTRSASCEATYCWVINSNVDSAAVDAVLDSLRKQQRACAKLGSTFYELVLETLAQDYVDGGITHKLLSGVSDRPVHDALPLRLLGGLHAIALSGLDADLSGQFPSTGGAPTEDLTSVVLASLGRHRAALSQSVRENVQTNEVGRSLVAMSITRWLPTIGAATCRWFEVGASAGLNLNFPRFHASTDRTEMGDPTSAISFGSEWFVKSPPHGASAECVELRGCDPFPIDVTDVVQQRKLLGFVWPDQDARLARLRRAIEIATVHRPRLDRADAGQWLASIDASPQRDGQATVVYHSIVWQYMSLVSRRQFLHQLHLLAKTSSHDRPVVWARMEPAGDTADIRATVWTGKDIPRQYELGRVGYHGQDLRWSPREFSE
jgi:hypothetical protein